MAEIRDYSTSPDPQTADRWPENMAMSAVNDTGREDEGILARWYRDTRGDLADTGSANAYTVAPNRSFSGAYDGLEIIFKAANANTGASTLTVTGVTTANILSAGRQPLQGGEIRANAKIHVISDGTDWLLISSGVKESRFIDVKDYGAVGDGTTNEDAAFAAAESARSAKGWQQVHVPEGTYLLTTEPDWDLITGAGKISYNSQSLPAGDIRQAIGISVPSGLSTINVAWKYLTSRRILGQDTSVTIQVADGIYNLANQFVPNHPDGANIRALGNQTTPDNCVLNFTHGGVEDGIRVDNGHTLGFLDGFKIQLPTKAERPNIGSGLIVEQNATVICGQNMRIENFYFGAQARYGGHLRYDSGEVRNAGDSGILGFLGGSVQSLSAKVFDTADATEVLGVNINAESGGVVFCNGAETSGGKLGEIASFLTGILRTEGALTTVGDERRAILNRGAVTVEGPNDIEDLFLSGKGVGSYVSINSPFFTTPPPIEGFVLIKDSSGQIIQLAGKVFT